MIIFISMGNLIFVNKMLLLCGDIVWLIKWGVELYPYTKKATVRSGPPTRCWLWVRGRAWGSWGNNPLATSLNRVIYNIKKNRFLSYVVLLLQPLKVITVIANFTANNPISGGIAGGPIVAA